MHDPVELIAYLLFFGLLPFLVIGLTSFVKFSVVLGLLRNALGIQNIPSNIVIYSMAVILSFYVMLPPLLKASEQVAVAQAQKKSLLSEANNIVAPFADFVKAHTPKKEADFYKETAVKLWGEKTANELTGPNATTISQLIITVPAFLTSELTKAFLIGFMLYLPFLVIDLVVANILLALGMSTLSPITVSLPIKILLFIGLDGWTRLFEALVLSYA